MFTGNVKQRNVSMAGKKKRTNRADVLAKAKADRNQREIQRRRQKCSVILQTWWRGVRARLLVAVSQRQLLDAGLREEGVRYASLTQAGQPLATNFPALTRLIQAYNLTTRHRFAARRAFAEQDFGRTCNLARLILLSCTNSDPSQNMCRGLDLDNVWLERLHAMLRGMLLNLYNKKTRIQSLAVLPAQALLLLLNPKQWSSPASCASLCRLMGDASSLGPSTFDALGEFLNDREESWLSAPARSHLVQALSIATTMSLRPVGPASPGGRSGGHGEWYANVAMICLMRPLMAHGREMYTLLLEPILKQGGGKTWEGVLRGTLQCLTEEKREGSGSGSGSRSGSGSGSGSLSDPAVRVLLASNILAIANQEEIVATSESQRLRLQCLSILFDDIPTTYLFTEERRGQSSFGLRTSSGGMMDISDSDEEEESDMSMLMSV